MLLIKVLLFFCYCFSSKNILLSLAPFSLGQAIKINFENKRKHSDSANGGRELEKKSKKSIQSPQKKTYQCDICQQECVSPSNLIIHQRTHSGEKPYPCDKCDKRFSQSHNLLRHEKIHSGEKPYQCDICQKRFIEKRACIQHRRTHTGEKPYACDACDKCFTSVSALQMHKRKHRGEIHFQCDVCGREFTSTGNCNRHKKKHSGDNTHKCDVCKKIFTRGDSLQVHKKTQHPKEKFYECKKCEQRFENLLSWEWHEKKHSKDQCFHCLLCDESFAKGGMLHVHMQKYFTNRPLSVSCINRDCKKQFSDILELFFHCFTEHLKNPNLIDDLKIEFVLFLKKLLKDKKVSDDKDSVTMFFKNNDNVLIKQLEIEFKNKKEYPLLEFVEIIRSLFLEDLLTLLLDVRWSRGNHIENQNRGVANDIPKKYELLDNDPLFLLDLQEEKLSHQEFALFLKIFLDVFYEKTVPSKIMRILNKHVTDRSA